MSRKTLLFSVLVAIALVGQACRLAQTPSASPISVPTDLQPTLSLPASSPVPIQANSSTPRTVPTATPISTPTPQAVSITAVGGDLAIRLGPADVFDAVDVLKDGKTLPVYARSIQDGWLQVPIPSRSGALGWISTKTTYSRVDGYVLDLPMITTVEYPFGAYLLNCTSHQLLAQPGDTLVPPVNAAAPKGVWFYPGLYTVYDTEVQGQPEVTQVKLYPHTSVSVIKDGAGTKYTCH